MSIITLSNDVISAQINTLGAELCSLKNANNRESIWEGNPTYWGKHSPVLFPIVGTLKNNTYNHNNKEYQLTRHGFARDMEFELVDKTESTATFSIQSNSATLANYPFQFEQQIQYTLVHTTLEIAYTVINKDSTEIPFSIGAHPAFALPGNFENFPNLGIWTKVGAPFICIEPWFGYSDTTESNGNLFEKEGIIILKTADTFQAKFSIEIL